MQGTSDSGSVLDVPVTPEGHLEVAIHSPRLPFGSISVESLTPVFQSDGVYGINSGQIDTTSSLSGSCGTTFSSFVVSTGTTIYSQASIQSRKRLRYRAGQGIIGRFAGYFSQGVTQSYQVAGFGHAEDGVYFGYKNEDFGILYNNRGVREVRTLTITSASSTNETAIVTLSGATYGVSVTNSANVQRTVWEISQGTYAGWDAYPSGSTVVFVKNSVGSANNSYSISGTSLAGTFSRTKAGEAANELFVPQSEWNGDKLDGTGASGFTIDPTKGNVFEIGIQYLGYGTVVFKVEIVSDSNNADFITVHTLRNPNTRTITTFGNPSYPFTMAAYSAGSTSSVSVTVGSFAGFIEGHKRLHGNRFSYFNSLTTVGATNYQALFTIMNSRYYAGMANQAVVNLLSVTAAVKHSNPVILYLIKGGSLAGNPNFTQYSSNSCTLFDNTATTVTLSTNDQILWSGHLGETGELDHILEQEGGELTLQPGEWVTLAAKSVFGAPT